MPSLIRFSLCVCFFCFFLGEPSQKVKKLKELKRTVKQNNRVT